MAQSSATFLADFSQDREKNAGRADALFYALAVVPVPERLQLV